MIEGITERRTESKVTQYAMPLYATRNTHTCNTPAKLSTPPPKKKKRHIPYNPNQIKIIRNALNSVPEMQKPSMLRSPPPGVRIPGKGAGGRPVRSRVPGGCVVVELMLQLPKNTKCRCNCKEDRCRWVAEGERRVQRGGESEREGNWKGKRRRFSGGKREMVMNVLVLCFSCNCFFFFPLMWGWVLGWVSSLRYVYSGSGRGGAPRDRKTDSEDKETREQEIILEEIRLSSWGI